MPDIELDVSIELPPFSVVCSFCTNLRSLGEGRTCEAFPQGIPSEIWLGRNKHQDPYEGDNGIRFDDIAEKD